MNNSHETVSSQIRRHSRQLVREMSVVNVSYLNTGYTISQCHVLFELSPDSSLKLLELADRLLMDKSNTSRTVGNLVELGLIKVAKSPADGRQRIFSLTAKGKKTLRTITGIADAQVEKALENLDEEQQKAVIHGLNLFADALRKSRLQATYQIRSIQASDNAQVAEVIRGVLTEFKAVGEGYSIVDSEIDDMYTNYQSSDSCYYVITHEERVVGCGGLAPLEGSDSGTCELRKMFLLPVTRGIGLGRRLLGLLLDEARARNYQRCYLETLDRMSSANELYRRNGFERVSQPLGSTGHCGCDRWYLLEL